MANQHAMMDDLDCSILCHLCKNSRASTTAIAQKLGGCTSTVHNQINRLKESGIIERFSHPRSGGCRAERHSIYRDQYRIRGEIAVINHSTIEAILTATVHLLGGSFILIIYEAYTRTFQRNLLILSIGMFVFIFGAISTYLTNWCYQTIFRNRWNVQLHC
ncbi:MAG: hypothetical protein C4B59_06895 [Candidatus Methanogaster sp.]|uniref:Uncharacterized protein n=1 Tax=Candidatus Methanogaster sp. TaxID=3386292 RepID=A0AC61L3N5_9EURY|nr:MAG: hypothetical protein C4B59_06895 [ANME-2 cluster archaeon]